MILSNKIDDIITQLSKDENSWFIVANLYKLLSITQKENIKEQLDNVDFSAFNNERVWRIFLYFSTGDIKRRNKIKKGILQNKNLWNTGFNDDGSLSMVDEFISIKSLNNRNSSLWSKSEVNVIYKKLEREFVKIEDWCNRRNEPDFRYILEEMICFIDEEREKLSSIVDLESTYSRVLSLYNKNKGYSNIIEGLISNDSNKVVWALSELSYNLSHQKLGIDFVTCIGVLINKVLLGNSAALEASISYLVSFISDKRNYKVFKNYLQQIILILKRYANEIPENSDKVFLYWKMIKLSESLKKYSVQDEIINYWGKKNKENRYYH